MRDINYNFIEIGTADFDTLIQSCSNEIGLSIEPILLYLNNLPNKPNVAKVNCAIGSRNEIVDVFWIDPDDIVQYKLPDWLRGCNSIINPHPSALNELKLRNLEKIYKISKCECITWPTLVSRYNIGSVEYLKIDAEGSDCTIINNILDSNSILPTKITFENNILSDPNYVENTLIRLREFGYTKIESNHDEIKVERTNNSSIKLKNFQYNTPEKTQNNISSDTSNKEMRIDKIIFAIDDNPIYAGFWEINSEICSKVLGITPVLFHITNENSYFYEDKFGIVKKIKAVEGINTGLQSQLVRLYGTSYFPDDVCMISDIDMLLFNKKYINENLSGIKENDLVLFNSDAYDSQRLECAQVPSESRYPMCYIAGKGMTFNKIINISMDFSEFCVSLNNMGLGWDTDELYFAKQLKNNHNVKVHRLIRGYSSEYYAPNRIEKHNFTDIGTFKLNLNGFINIDNFIDCHCARPYSVYKSQIDNIKNQIINKNSYGA